MKKEGEKNQSPKNNPSEDFEIEKKAKKNLWITSDGIKFISENLAENHARGLEDKTIKVTTG